jgi:regulator of protease activity HflC (stomatin/prohibitin superfamily)
MDFNRPSSMPDLPRPNMSGVSTVRMVLIGLVAVIVALIALGAFTRVDAGEACVVRRFGDVRRTLPPGLHMKLPLAEDTACFSTRSLVYEVVDESGTSNADYLDFLVDGVTVDGQPLSVTYTVRFRVAADDIEYVYSNIARSMDQVTERVVKFHSRAEVRQVVNTKTAGELYLGGLETISVEIEEILRRLFAESGVTLDFFEIKRPNFSSEYERAIEDKQIAIEQADRKENEIQVAAQEAARLRTEAQGEADAAVIRAQGESDSLKIRAEAYNDNPILVTIEYYRALQNINWAIFGADGGANPIIPIPPLDQDEDGAIIPSPTPAPEPEPEPEAETEAEEPADEEEAAQGFAGTRSA